MNYVTTNLRFPKEEYEELKRLAFISNKSIAEIIRLASREYRKRRSFTIKDKMKLFNQMAKSRIKIDISTVDLVKEGRKFE